MEVSAEDNSGPESETKYNSVIEEKTPESFIEDIADDYVHYTKFDSAKEVNVHTILSNIRRGRGTSKRRMTACFPRNVVIITAFSKNNKIISTILIMVVK